MNPIRSNPRTRLLDNTIDRAAMVAAVYVLWGLRPAAWLTLILAVLSAISSGVATKD